jgi:hypothetical protein
VLGPDERVTEKACLVPREHQDPTSPSAESLEHPRSSHSATTTPWCPKGRPDDRTGLSRRALDRFDGGSGRARTVKKMDAGEPAGELNEEET